MKRWVIVGLENSGKSTLCDYIENEKSKRVNTQDLRYRKKTLEVPSSYLENTWMNNIIIMLAQNQGKGNIFLLDGARIKSMYSPAYAKAFTKPTIGVVTKSDLLEEKGRLKAKKILEEVVCDKIIFLSFVTNEGINELSDWLDSIK